MLLLSMLFISEDEDEDEDVCVGGGGGGGADSRPAKGVGDYDPGHLFPQEMMMSMLSIGLENPLFGVNGISSFSLLSYARTHAQP